MAISFVVWPRFDQIFCPFMVGPNEGESENVFVSPVNTWPRARFLTPIENMIKSEFSTPL